MSHNASSQYLQHSHRGTRYIERPSTSASHRPTIYDRPVLLPVPERETPENHRTIPNLPARKNKRKQPKADQTLKKLALLLPGHNEELIIGTTIKSAVAAGMSRRDIYVVDDNSDDATRKIAISMLGESNVLSVGRSGKALAVRKALKHFDIARRYTWVHVADADSVFSPDYFRIYSSKLNGGRYAVAVGFVQSLRGNWISTYRAMMYTYSQHVQRRIQSYLGMISVFPGPITAFRTDILAKLDIDNDTIAEDFDITLQVHRKKLGRIIFIPKAINYTQDPQTLRDFIRQNQRWQRGFFQGVKKYQIGLHAQKIDISLGFQVLQAVIFLVQLFFIWPIILIVTHNWIAIPVALAADFILNGCIALGSSIVAKRWNLLGALPYFYLLRWIEVGVFLWAFVEIMILKKFQSKAQWWSTEGRRYKISSAALQDIAA